jgi:hypothetical protein
VLARDKVQYVVSDLIRVYAVAPEHLKPGRWEAGPDMLPPNLPPDRRALFPLNRPAVWRSRGGTGRYILHEMTGSFGPFDHCLVLDVWDD